MDRNPMVYLRDLYPDGSQSWIRSPQGVYCYATYGSGYDWNIAKSQCDPINPAETTEGGIVGFVQGVGGVVGDTISGIGSAIQGPIIIVAIALGMFLLRDKK